MQEDVDWIDELKRKKNGMDVTSATPKEGSGCNEDQATEEEDGDTVGKEVR